MQDNPIIRDLKLFLDQSPTAWHAVDNISHQLISKGFKELHESERWQIEKGQAYFVQRNRSSLCAFIIPELTPERIRLFASHTDSPGLKLKPKPEIRKFNTVLFGVEIYGAPLLTSWLNIDLGLAGRVVYLDDQQEIHEGLVNLYEYPLMIPQLAIHLDREVNEKGLLLNKQEHLNALAALDTEILKNESYLEMILKTKIKLKELIDFELFLYPLEKARLLGFGEQLIASYRIDSLSSVHAILHAFLQDIRPLDNDIKMVMFWDNEEIGSSTAQGAESTFFNQVAERISYSMQIDREDYFRLINRSTCFSVDLAHALHPNYADKHDPQHQPLLGSGIILKHNAQQRYATDARTSLPVQIMGNLKQIPLQKFVSKNDIPCGSTIGPLQASVSGMPTVDIGCGQLSMHSSREIIACQDQIWLCQLLEALLSTSDWPKIVEASGK
jgi:aspartyl aminopeptidase